MSTPRAGQVRVLDDGAFLPLVWDGSYWIDPPEDEPAYEDRAEALHRSLKLSGADTGPRRDFRSNPCNTGDYLEE